MTWKTATVTYVECNDPHHVGDPVFCVGTSYLKTAREALMVEGWGYDHTKNYHTCPTCVTRNVRRN